MRMGRAKTVQTGLIFIVCYLVLNSANATHISGADFNYQCVGQDSFYVTLNLFRDCTGIAAPKNARVTFKSDCGQSFTQRLYKQNGVNGTEISQLCPGSITNSTCSGGMLPGMQQHIYAALVVLTPPCNTWTMQWSLCCRNTTVNLVGQPEMLVEASLNSVNDSCNNSPVFNAQPILYVCLNQPVDYNFAVTEPDGDSIVYSFINPLDQVVGGTAMPVPFSAGYNFSQPIAGITLNTSTGQLNFTPTIQGNFVLAVQVCEYDYTTGLLQGCVVRDIQFVIIQCTNQAPQAPSAGISSFTGTGALIAPDSVLVCDGNTFSFDLVFTDPDVGDSVTLTSNADVVLPGSTVSIINGNPATITISGTATNGMPPLNTFVVTAIDNACPIPATTTASYKILVQQKPSVTVSPVQDICRDNVPVTITGNVANASSGIWSGAGAMTNTPGGLVNSYTPTGAELSSGTASVFLTSTGNGNCSAVIDTLDLNFVSFNSTISSTIEHVNCNGGTDGKATLNFTAGFQPISVSWNTNPIQIGDSAINLVAGTYIASLVDSNGCDTTVSVTITQPQPLATTVTVNSHVSCTGGNNGMATIGVTGGTSPYTYLWGSSAQNQTTVIGTSLFAGTHSVTVTDANGCVAVQTVVITQPNYPMSVNVATTDVACYGDNNGSATATVTGGTIPYNYSWAPNGQTVNPITNLSGGVYSVTVIDNSGMCVVQTGIVVNEPLDIHGTNTSTLVLCNGESTGIASFTPTGGISPFTYQWGVNASNQTTPTVNNLTAGSYFVTLTDVNGCVFDTSVLVSEPNPISFITSSSVVLCNGGSDGAASVSLSGGVAPYSVSWNSASPQNGLTASNLSMGTYTATIIDSNGCDTSVAITVNEPPVLTGTIVAQTNVSCTGGFNGQATISGVGGTLPYSYQWDVNARGQITATADSLFAGTYAVTITDNSGCTVIQNITITQPNYALSVNVTTTDISCNGLTDGSASALASGGTTPYAYQWAPGGQNTSTITNLPVSINTLTVVDNSGQCIVQTGISITEPTPLTSTSTMSEVSCYNGTNGTSTITGNGGVAPYIFVWDANANNQTNATATNLSAGGYIFTMTDANGCLYDSNIVITEPNALAISPMLQMPLCFGDANGVITATPSGGTTPYTYSWGANAGSSSTSGASLLATGYYSVTVTDSNSCVQDSTFFLSEPTPVTLGTAQLNMVGCYGDSTGSAIITGGGGTSPYTFEWNSSSNLEPSSSVQNLWAGSFTVTITDTNGCDFDTVIQITQPNFPLSITSNITDVGCFGDSTGSITSVPTGGTSPYVFSWDSLANNQSTQTAINLPIGSYRVTVTDSNGCQDSLISIINQPVQPLTINTLGNDVLCFGDSTGFAEGIGNGGTLPYTYQWDGAANNQTDSIAISLAIGNYSVTVTDSNGCQSDTNIEIYQPQALSFAAIGLSDVNCYGGTDGEASVTVNGGILPYSYLWGANSNTQILDTAINLAMGTHTITVTDSNGCLLDTALVIHQPLAPLNVDSAQVPTLCNGDSNGVAVAIPNGGTAPYTYYWNNATIVTSDSLFNVSAGTYFVLVEDLNGCQDSTSVIVSQPDVLQAVETSNNSVDCFGNLNGSATISGVGGVTPYQFAWPFNANYQTDSVAINLGSGAYQVTVTDTNGCEAMTTINISQPPYALTNTVVISTPLCFGDTNGLVAALPHGGTAPYTYQWSGALGVNTSDTAINVGQGSYIVTITDTNLCQVTTQFIVDEPAILEVSSVTISDALCHGEATGTGMVNVIGGTLPYMYLWDVNTGSQSQATAINLITGNYTITVSDSNGCVIDSTIFISEPQNLLQITASTSDVNCFGGNDGEASTSVVGGTNPYSIQWGQNTGYQTGNVANNLSNGNYQAIVTDDNGCLDTVQISINQPAAALTTTSIVNNVTCFGFTDGNAQVNTVGGTAPYTTIWGPLTGNQTGVMASNLAIGNYQSFITDANGCKDTATVIIIQPDPITAYGSPDDTVCTQANFNVEVQAFGGNGGYTYTWNNGLGNNNFHTTTTVNSNTYTVTVSDALGCPGASTTINITVNRIYEDSLSVWKDKDVCEGESANLFADYNGTFGTYTYTWSNGLGNGSGPISVTPYQSTIYQVTVTDECNSSVFDFVIVNVLQTPVVNVPAVVAADCGPLTVLFEDQVNDSGTFTYLWDFGDGSTSTDESPTHTFTNTGTYAINVIKTSHLGCPGELVGPSVVTVHPTPVAHGEPDKYVTDITSPTIHFTDLSTGANSIRWDFSPTDFATTSNPSYTYPDTGIYQVLLTAMNQFGCEADYLINIQVNNGNKIVVPNAFIPNGTGGNGGAYDATSLANDVFYARLAEVEQFHMTIFNRWGELIFESFDVNKGWDGYYREQISAQDVYVWKIDVIFKDGSQVSDVGNLTLLR